EDGGARDQFQRVLKRELFGAVLGEAGQVIFSGADEDRLDAGVLEVLGDGGEVGGRPSLLLRGGQRVKDRDVFLGVRRRTIGIWRKLGARHLGARHTQVEHRGG